MSVKKNFEDNQRIAKRKAETIEAENKNPIKKLGGARNQRV
jgi:hypothetical protein